MPRGWESSAEVDQLFAALVPALAALDEIKAKKTAKVPTKSGGEYSYKYADLGDALATCRPLLAPFGLAVLQSTHGGSREVGVATTIIHTSGQWIAFDPLVLSAGDTAQQAGSAVTYARRYTYLSSLGLATEDDDGRHVSSTSRNRGDTGGLDYDRESHPPPAPPNWREKFKEACADANVDLTEVCLAASEGKLSLPDQFRDEERFKLGEHLKRLQSAGTPVPAGAGPEGIPSALGSRARK